MRTKALFLTLFSLFLCLCLWSQAPIADFTSNAKTGCTPIIVNFQDNSTGNVTSWKWDFGNGATSTRQNPSTTYMTGGTYTVKLTVSNESGSNTVSKTGFITVYDGPAVNFTSDKTSSCAPGRIKFTDNSTASPGTVNSSWLWDFGDGTSSTEQNPLHIYRTTGKFTVLLKVTNDKGCTKVISKPNLITITPGITINFTNSLPAFCKAPANINFTNTTSGPGTLTYTWLYGDGTSTTPNTVKNTSHIYTKNGTFPVSLVVSSNQGCVDTLTKSTAVTIGGITSNFTTPQILCATNSVSFTNSSTPAPASSSWRFPDGTSASTINAAKTFAAAGSYEVKLINNYNYCRDTITKTITVAAKPVVDFTAPATVSCSTPFTANFQNRTNEAVSYAWTFGDGGTSTLASPSYTYKDTNLYNVKLKATNAAGCTDSTTKASFIKVKKPRISFSNLPVRGCIPYELSPTAVITSVDQVLTYEWDFGDGGKATGLSPKHTYTNQGTYIVKLTITTSTGCTETYSLPNAVRVGTKPTVDFSANYTETCASTPVQFSDRSATPTDEYSWSFGDGGTSNTKNPRYTFTKTGSQNVTFTAYNNGCGTTVTKTDFINIIPPIAKFTFKPNCNNRLEYEFTDQSIGAQTWEWTFGPDNAKASGQKVTHTFPDKGSYSVSLKVTNGTCNYTSTSTVRIIDQTPNFTASSQVGCKNFTTRFQASSPVQVSALNWQFGDGRTGSGWSPTTTYTRADSFNVKLIVTDIYGCKDSITKDDFIIVNGPIAAFDGSSISGCRGLTANFEDKSTTFANNAIVNWQWNFGDGTAQSTEQSPAHKYDAIGNFPVKLIVQDAAGCKDSITRANFVKVSTINAAWDAVKESCPKSIVTFNNTTTGTYTSTWTFGDNTQTSTIKSPTHAYEDTGYYTIKLKVRENTTGCEDSLTRENYLYIGKPVADFTANNLVTFCTPFEGRFTNTSKFYTSNVWKFQSSTSTVQDLLTFYNNTVKDSVKLIVTSPGGCKDSVAKLLEIKNAAEGLVTYGPLVACSPVTVNLQAFEPINARFTWDFGDGNIIDTSVNMMTHVYKDFGKFVPMVILEEQCVIPLKGKDTIQVNGVDARFGMNQNLFCDTGTVVFTDSSIFNNPISAYRWDFGDGDFSAQKNPIHSYKKIGSYTVRLNVQTQSGCSDSATFSAVRIAQNPRITVSGDTAVCIGEKVQFVGSFKLADTSAVRWQWYFPNGNNSTIQNPEQQVFTTEGDYQVRTFVTNSSGCKDSVILPLHVHTMPSINMPATLTTYSGANLKIPASYSPGIINYTWSPAEGLSCTDCPQPVATPKNSTKYSVIATDANGCTITSDLTLSVLCQNSNVFLPNTFSPNGDGRNDIFYVRGKGLDRVKTFKVFNRWGEVVFEKREIPLNIESKQYGWDGMINGRKPHPDVYIYHVEVICDNGEIIQTKGSIALIQ